MDRFWSKVTKSDGCWLWAGTTDGRYGLVSVDGRMLKAHRVSWELHNGPIPAGMVVCHTCDTPRCVRPDHLFLGTMADNSHDRDRKGRQRSPLGEASPNAKLTEDDVRAIRASDEPASIVGPRYGVTPTNVGYIRDRRTWRHVA